MNEYDVIITPDAEQDLVDIKDYIAYELMEPEIAIEYIRRLRDAIIKLSYSATSIKFVNDEPWHSKGIKKITAENFYVYFRIDENSNRVYVLCVIYSKRDQKKVLLKKNIT